MSKNLEFIENLLSQYIEVTSFNFQNSHYCWIILFILCFLFLCLFIVVQL